MKYIIGSYSQLPYGSYDTDYELLLENQLRPLLTFLYQNSDTCLVLRLGNNVFEWLENNHPEINMLIFDLCRKNQLELLTSPQNDVALSLVPAHERSVFVEKTTTYLRKRFSKKPNGFFNTYQLFSPSLLGTVSLSSIDYIITSTYSQTQSKVLYSKPFIMNELGKSCLIIPSDDRFSKAVYELSKNKDLSKNNNAELLNLLKESTGNPTTIMINLDQICPYKDSVKCFYNFFEYVGKNCTLPSTYFKDCNINNFYYLPEGIYGRDFNIGKSSSINQIILEDKRFLKYYNVLSFMKDIVREFKKNSDERKKLEVILSRAENSSPLFSSKNTNCYDINCKYLCEAESILANMDISVLPLSVDITSDSVSEDVIYAKNHIAYLNKKGAVLERYVSFSLMRDFANYNSFGMFSDTFSSLKTKKSISTLNKIFDINYLDKKRNDFVASLNNLDLDNNQFKLYKRFRFKQNLFCLDIDIENTSEKQISELIYQNIVNINLSDNILISVQPESKTDFFEVLDNRNNIKIQFSINCPLIFKYKLLKSNDNTYKYHQLFFYKDLNIKPLEIEHIQINMKIDKVKEKTQ